MTGSSGCLNCPFGSAQDRDLFDLGISLISVPLVLLASGGEGLFRVLSEL